MKVGSVFYLLADGERCQFIQSLAVRRGQTHVIRRNYTYDDVLDLYKREETLSDFPLRVCFTGEMAIDIGGVCRDMFSAFWEATYTRLFDGGNLLVPALHALRDVETLQLLGRILSHGYLVTGFLPVRIAFPALCSILLTPVVSIPDSILFNTFVDNISSYDASVIKEALTTEGPSFTPVLLSKLLTILSRFGCRALPTPQSLRTVIPQLAQVQFQAVPMATINAMFTGIPIDHTPFWKSQSVPGLYSLYVAMTANPQRIFHVLEEPTFANSNEERIYGYLQQFIGGMDPDQARIFLRYVTGSSVCIARNIKVTFNSLSGLARRPIAHTCGCMLELPSTYLTYLEFLNEFQAILSDDEFTWRMDSV